MGGGSGRGVGLGWGGAQVGCEQRIEVLVKSQKKNKKKWEVGVGGVRSVGGGVGGGEGSGWGGGGQGRCNREVKFL